MKIKLAILLLLAPWLLSCSENYSNGFRVGLITQFSQTGVWWKSWEGHLNLTQTGMNSSVPFDFSVDNDNEPAGLVDTLRMAADKGWKVRLNYHETIGKNCFSQRGHTDHFITSCEVIERHMNSLFGGDSTSTHGKTLDTIYVVIVPKTIAR